VIAELRPRLVGARLQDVRVPAADRVVLSFRSPGATCHLLLVVQSVHARLHPLDRPPRNPARALPVQGLLRRLLTGACESIEQVGDDRLVRLSLGRISLLGELTGRHGNLFILDDQDRILTPLLPNRSHRRELVAGRPYVAPAAFDAPSRPPRFQPPGVGAQLASHYSALEATESIDGARTASLRRLRGVRRRLERKADRQRAEAERHGEADRLRREADLLNASFGLLRRGLNHVEVPDVFAEEAPQVRIELDPARSPRDQIERRYRQARRLERGMKRAAEELSATREELGRALEAIAAVESAGDEGALQRLVDAFPTRWRPAEPRRSARTQGERLPYRAYRTAGGQRILVGRSAVDNDALTFRHARGRDTWLHVVARPGAHVIVPFSGSAPDPLVLEAAAQLALAHSGFREGDTAEVAWTRVKYVRKLKGGAPGQVTYSQERTLFVSRTRDGLDGVQLDE